MTTNDIIRLLDAGYTKDEIIALETPAETTPETPAETTPETPAETAPETPAETPEHDPELDNIKNELSETRKQLANLVKQMQANNRQIASVNILPGDDLDKKTDEAMAELIRPKINEGG